MLTFPWLFSCCPEARRPPGLLVHDGTRIGSSLWVHPAYVVYAVQRRSVRVSVSLQNNERRQKQPWSSAAVSSASASASAAAAAVPATPHSYCSTIVVLHQQEWAEHPLVTSASCRNPGDAQGWRGRENVTAAQNPGDSACERGRGQTTGRGSEPKASHSTQTKVSLGYTC